MPERAKHKGHLEPSYIGTALTGWALAILPVWALSASIPDYNSGWGALLFWGPVVFILVATMECRHTQFASGKDNFIVFVVLVAPWVAAVLVWIGQ